MLSESINHVQFLEDENRKLQNLACNKNISENGPIFEKGTGLEKESFDIPSLLRQKGESQSRCYKKTKHAKFSEKRKFLTP